MGDRGKARIVGIMLVLSEKQDGCLVLERQETFVRDRYIFEVMYLRCMHNPLRIYR